MTIEVLRKVLEGFREVAVEQQRRTQEKERMSLANEVVNLVSEIARGKKQRSSEKQRNWRREIKKVLMRQKPSEDSEILEKGVQYAS